jgi:hypothetical protein
MISDLVSRASLLFKNMRCWHLGRRAIGTLPPRDRKFAALTDADLGFFRSLLPFHGGVVTDEHDLEPFNVDWMKQYRGKSRLGLTPKTTDQAILTCSGVRACGSARSPRSPDAATFGVQVSSILRYCNERSIAVVPQGGNTGLVGGSVPVHDEARGPMRMGQQWCALDAYGRSF